MKPRLPSTKAGLLLCALVIGIGLAASASANGSSWNGLTAPQKQILAPLQKDWPSLDAQRRQKWLEVASRFNSLPPEEQARVKERMVEWSRMSAAQRTRARLVFQEARQLPPDERQARWEAYRSLSPEARLALAQRANPAAKPVPAPAKAEPSGTNPAAKRNVVQTASAHPPKAVAPTVVQARPGATTSPMATRAAPPLHHQAGLPKIAATPTFVDQATLLPKRGPQGAATRSVAAHDPKAKPDSQP